MDSTDSKPINRKGFIEDGQNYSKKKLGLPPGSLIYFGETRSSEVVFSCYSYNSDKFTKQLNSRTFSNLKLEKGLNHWVNVDALHEVDKIQEIGDFYSLHRLMLEDILDTTQRPKLELYDNEIFLTLKMLRWSGEDSKAYLEQVSFVLGKSFVLSFQETKDDVFQSIRQRIEEDKGQVRKKGADYLFYILLDTIVDHYVEVIEVFSKKVEKIESEALLRPKPNTVAKIQKLRKQLRFLVSTVLPLKDAVAKIDLLSTELIEHNTHRYFKDVHDHLLQCTELLDHNRDILINAANLYHGSLSTNMNNVMKVLAIISTIFMPLSFIAGLYGMNFRYMPELEKPYAYPVVLSVMFIIIVSMFFYFRNKKWL